MNDALSGTSTTAQQARVLAALEQGPQTTESLRELGVFHAAGRVRELRAQGHNIITLRITENDREGYRHHNTARYVLLAPKGAAQ